MHSKNCEPPYGGEEKLYQSSPKSLKNRYGLMPVTVPNFIAFAKQCMRNVLKNTFYSLVDSGTSEDPLDQSLQILELTYNWAWSINTPNFIAFWQPVHELSAAKLCGFRWQCDQQTKTQPECGPMPNLMVALLNIGGALCSTPQSLADAHYLAAVH